MEKEKNSREKLGTIKKSKSFSIDKLINKNEKQSGKRRKSKDEQKSKNHLKSKTIEKPEIKREKRTKIKSKKKNIKNTSKEREFKKSSSKDKTKKNENKIKNKNFKKKETKKEKEEQKQKESKKEKKEKKEKEEDISIEDIFFQREDLYSLLGLQRTATSNEIRKSYKRLVLLCHPDKNKTDPEACSKFINITKAYKILSNEKSRKYYDETGEYDEENQGEINIHDTLYFFRKIYSPHDIETYEYNYIGSKEEEQDLINFYNENDGDIKRILECIPCSNNIHVKRFIDIYKNLFKKKILKKNKKFEETKNKIILLKENNKEKKEAQKIFDKLTNQIITKHKKRNYNDYLECLATKKYGLKFDEDVKQENSKISEEDFQKISNTLNKEKKEKNKILTNFFSTKYL